MDNDEYKGNHARKSLPKPFSFIIYIRAIPSSIISTIRLLSPYSSNYLKL